MEKEKLLGIRIRERRKELGMSQRELGNKAGLTAASISVYEQGTKFPSLRAAAEIARILQISLDDLAFGACLYRDERPEYEIEKLLWATYFFLRANMISVDESDPKTLKVVNPDLKDFLRKAHQLELVEAIDEEIASNLKSKLVKDYAEILMNNNQKMSIGKG